MQEPLCLLQTPPFSQPGQVCVQPGPQDPSGHTETTITEASFHNTSSQRDNKLPRLTTHSSRSAFLMFQLDIDTDP